MDPQRKAHGINCTKNNANKPASVQGDKQETIRQYAWRHLNSLLVFCTMAIALPMESYAHDKEQGAAGVKREVLHTSTLPDVRGYIVTALTIEIAPGMVVAPHRHDGFVYVYLLQGRMRSQMEGEDPVEYSAGQSWIERAGALHQHTENPSETEAAKFLAVIYSKKNAVITQPEKHIHN